MEQKEKLVDLLHKLTAVFVEDERIDDFECIGSVKNNCITNHSDLDITIYIKSDDFVKIFNRKELEKLFSVAGLKALAINYDTGMCIGLFEGNVIADMVFRSSNGMKVEINKPKHKEEMLADICRIFWLDCFYFIQLLDDDLRKFRWEAIRGINVIRECHILKLLFLDETKGFPAFKKINGQDEGFFNDLLKTLATDDSESSLKITFKNLIIIFNDLYKKLNGPIVPEIQDLQKHICQNLMFEMEIE